MKAFVQRVTQASVTVEDAVIGKIGSGLLILLGVTAEDTEEECDMLAEKICKLRIFADENDKTNCSVTDVGGSLLVVSQFTLCADCRKGTRPSFSKAGPPEEANRLYQYFTEQCRRWVPQVETGKFGAHMQVALCNDGPFSIWLDTDELKKPRRQ